MQVCVDSSRPLLQIYLDLTAQHTQKWGAGHPFRSRLTARSARNRSPPSMPASAHAKCSAVRRSGGENEACGRLRRQVLETAKGMTDADVEHMKELVKGA